MNCKNDIIVGTLDFLRPLYMQQFLLFYSIVECLYMQIYVASLITFFILNFVNLRFVGIIFLLYIHETKFL